LLTDDFIDKILADISDVSDVEEVRQITADVTRAHSLKLGRVV